MRHHEPNDRRQPPLAPPTTLPPPRLTIAQVNALDRDAFVARFGALYEGSPWVAAAAWPARPFADLAELEHRLAEAVAHAPPERHLALIRAHPDLVGRGALAGSLGPASTAEQTTAGLDRHRLTPEQIATFADLNHRYRNRFGFPFVICARDNKQAAILAGFRRRLDHDRETEIATALAEIAKIAHHRLRDVVEGP